MAKDTWIERQLKEAKKEYDSWASWKKEALMREVGRGTLGRDSSSGRFIVTRTNEGPSSPRKKKST